jgi:hypothetical protein
MKRLLLFIVITLIIGIGILFLTPPTQDSQDNEIDLVLPNSEIPQRNEFAEPTPQVIDSLIPKILGARFNETTATKTIKNIDGVSGLQLIVGAIENTPNLDNRPVRAIIHVVTLTTESGEYDRIGSIEYTEWMRGVPEVKELQDVNGDGQQDIILSLVDFENKKLRWLQMQTPQGQVQDAVFILAGSPAHWNSVDFKDTNGDNTRELIEIFSQQLPFQEQEIECTTNVYTWNGKLFVYSAELSAETLQKLSSACEL